MIAAGELPHQAVGEIIKVVQTLAQVRIGLPQHARANVGLNALDCRFRSQPRHHRFLELVHPAAIVSEHAVGFENVAMFAAFNHIAVFKQLIKMRAQSLDR